MQTPPKIKKFSFGAIHDGASQHHQTQQISNSFLPVETATAKIVYARLHLLSSEDRFGFSIQQSMPISEDRYGFSIQQSMPINEDIYGFSIQQSMPINEDIYGFSIQQSMPIIEDRYGFSIQQSMPISEDRYGFSIQQSMLIRTLVMLFALRSRR